MDGDILKDFYTKNELLITKAQQGDSDSQYYAGLVYLGESQNNNIFQREGIVFLARAALQGHEKAQAAIKAIEPRILFEMRDKLINGTLCTVLMFHPEFFHFTSEVIKSDLELWLLCLDDKLIPAYFLGICYLKGIICEPNKEKAKLYIKQAADSGIVEAQSLLKTL